MNIIINEEVENKWFKKILSESFYPTTERVLVIKKYLDNNFQRSEIDDIGDDGYPKKVKSAVLMSNNKQPLKTMGQEELLTLLDDKFNHMINNKDDRRKFFGQIIKDWMDNKISKEGVLSVNFLK
jgi:hypothetical protein